VTARRGTAARRRGLLLAAVAAVALAGCDVEARIVVALHDDGRTGTVTAGVALDPDAVAALERGEGRLEDRVRLDGLAEAGFEVSPWRRTADGGADLEIGRSFDGERDLDATLEDLFGPDGLLAGARVVSDRGFVERRDSLSVRADLGRLDTGVAGDEELAARLRDAGVDPVALDAALDEDLREAFAMTVMLRAGDAEQSFRLAPGERRVLSVSTSERRLGRLVAALGAAGLALAGAGCFVLAGRSARRRGRRRSMR
jgi:hypothetical protein